MSLKPATLDAYNLLVDGAICFSRMEQVGIRIDTDYLARAITWTEKRISELDAEIRKDPVWAIWLREYGSRTKIDASVQLGHVIFDVLGYKRNPQIQARHTKAKYRPNEADVLKRGTKTTMQAEKYANDFHAFEHLDMPFISQYFTIKRMRKALGTYLRGIEREVVDGRIHPSFNLHSVESYRSCLAGGTLIETVRDVSRFPKGIPIEQVKAGDHVYCYDQNRRLTIRKVLWAGKTGTKKVVRLHWSARGKKGYIDLTPEHRVRMVDGSYVAVRNIDWSGSLGTRRYAKAHALAMGRRGDKLYETGNSEAILDHRLVYSCLIGPLDNSEVVHHKDENHLNNDPTNLEAMTLEEHGRHHVDTNLTPEARRRGTEIMLEMRKQGLVRVLSGSDHPNWDELSKFSLLRILARNGGRSSKTGRDFEFIRRRAGMLGVNLKTVKDRYDGDNRYLSLGRLVIAEAMSKKAAMSFLRLSFYRVDQAYADRGMEFNNHRLVRVEEIDQVVDVFDIEVEGEHNFIANEICVHNSCSQPNFHNFPTRMKELSKIVRSSIIPSDGCVLLEADYGAQEVRVSACYNKDPKLISCICGGEDMHKSITKKAYILTDEELGNTDVGVAKMARYCGKNMMVFPQFYGSVYTQCAPNLWDAIGRYKLTTANGTCLYDHLASKGIDRLGDCSFEKEPEKGTFELHLKEVERYLWQDMFPVYSQWKKDWWNLYLQNGGFHTLTGFTLEGVFRRNQVLCDGIQGDAFHCLLWADIVMDNEMRRRGMRSRLINQIHDSSLFDVWEPELDDVIELYHDIAVNRVAKHWPWIIVPLEVEFEICEENWHLKQKLDVSRLV
jgi:hypothetical protein